MSEWRDISTAPKDGAQILLFCGWEHPPITVVGYYGNGNPKPDPNICDDGSERWRVVWDQAAFDGGYGFWEATHWQPLPPPPKADT